ncbi:MAG: MGDG synthase family glycosyltransferase, partial [Candidatus Eiseniibacteriota bacterium]
MTVDRSSASRILILHATAGSGHKRAAQALEQAFQKLAPSAHVRALDTLHFGSRLFQRGYSPAYNTLVGRVPRVWGLLYKGLEHPRIHRGTTPVRHALDRINVRQLVTWIERERPTAVVCTHFLPLEALAPRRLRGMLACPLYCVITDFTAHPFWAIDGIDGTFVATAAVREELAAWGVEWERIHASGIPIDPRFTAGPLDRAASRQQFQLAPDRPTVLLMGGGNGIGPLANLAERLLALPAEPQLLVVCGRNARLRMRMRAVAETAPGRLRALGYTDQVPALLSAADVIVTKAGGLTCSESLAMGTPMVVFRPTPGQEEKNSLALSVAGAAVRARTFEQVASGVERILAHPALATSMREACRLLARPHAAEDIARRVLELPARAGAEPEVAQPEVPG